MNIRADMVKAAIFVVVTGLCIALVAATMGGIRIQDEHTYHAVFRDVSGLEKGVEVRAAGVAVGTVDDLELRPDNTVEVKFSMADEVPVSTGTQASVRYKNLTGDRYLDLTSGAWAGARLSPGSTIPLARTAPALDLDVLSNGFKPLMEGLSPQEINDLSTSLIAVFQGQSGAAESLLRHVGSLTTTLADKDQLIGDLVDNLNTVLKTANSRKTQLGDLIDQLQTLTSGLAAQRRTLGSSLAGIDDMTGVVADFLRQLRPELTGTITQVDRLSGVLNAEERTLDRYLGALPNNLQLTGRSSAYGSFFNFYLCGIRLKLVDAKGVTVYTPFVLSEIDRCQFREGGR